ncbi:calmodulin-2/4 isoform X1 [Eurytemora carolleeae]|uniref:calmodulin-2/4 isoform X1 n=1 Tax=Eurytemora carolleeae TaxID=1294199 RepID=UPI000C77A374|nr:calmodulin-2/4 isoform X1 [Eurytemora carolleeae]|eukprot:XP_023343694.1 calmodulin-2/4-like isoform X1 [Eurytemora affinis]
MRSIGSNPTEEEIEEMIDDADADGSGSVDFVEFVELMIKRESEKETPEDLKQAFRVFDKDGNGYVSTSELKYVLHRLGVLFTDNELQEMVQEADIDGDQHISFDEFRSTSVTSVTSPTSISASMNSGQLQLLQLLQLLPPLAYQL